MPDSLAPVSFQIKRVKNISFFVDETLFKPNAKIKFTLDRDLKYKLDTNMVLLNLSCFFHFDDSENKEALARIIVLNAFEVSDLKQFFTNDIRLPQDLIISMVSMSISHTRALLCENLAGTVYQDIMIPLTNPVEITRHFFKEWFEEDVKPVKDLPKNKKKKEGIK